jgi:hypothetical protein
MKKVIIFLVVLLVTLIQPYRLQIVHGFEVQGSKRVPTLVPRDQNLRDPQWVSVRILKVEPAYSEHFYNDAGLKCGYEQHAINPNDNRNWLVKMFNPRGPVHYETQYNCYNSTGVQRQTVFAGYMVTYDYNGRYYHKLVSTRPNGRYIKILVK